MDEINNIEEYALDSLELCEVVSTQSMYFSEVIYVSHRAYAAGKEWFRSAYPVSSGIFVWFSRNELEFGQE